MVWYNNNVKGAGMLWKFTKGPHKGSTALAVETSKLKTASHSEDKDFVTLYVDGKMISFLREALEQIAVYVDEQ